MAQDIRTYDGLISAAQSWLDSAESNLVDSIPNMIVMAESDFRRNLVTPDMEVMVTIDPSQAALPTDIDSIRSFVLLGDYQGPLTAVSPDYFYTLYNGQIGYPQFYTVSDNSLMIWPTPDQTYSASLIYRQAIPALSENNSTNWLLAAHPDAYLFGTLLQAEFFGWNDTRLSLIQAKLSSIIDDINTAGNRKRYGGALVMQPQVTDAVFRYS